MKNLFEKETVNEIIDRINQLTPQSKRQWGKMDARQMLAHCTFSMEVALDRKTASRVLIARLLGPFVKPIFINERPFTKNSPTGKEFIVNDQKDVKNKLKDAVTAFFEGGIGCCTAQPHAFFGKLSPEEWARGMYKHLDHHLRQFAV
jgi:hypothetical protein